MKRLHLLVPTLTVSGLFVGPTLFYAQTIVGFGFGFNGSAPLTHYVLDTLLQGSIIGLLIGVVCALNDYRPRPSGLWAGGLMGLLSLLSVAYQDSQGLLGTGKAASIFGGLLLTSAGEALMAYLLASLISTQCRSVPSTTTPLVQE